VAPYLLQGFGVTLDLTRWATALTGWQVATGVFGTIILIRLILAPYWIHKELHQQIEPSGRKREIRIALANFMEEGQPVKQAVRRGIAASSRGRRKHMGAASRGLLIRESGRFLCRALS
jgi:hypothetical protein